MVERQGWVRNRLRREYFTDTQDGHPGAGNGTALAIAYFYACVHCGFVSVASREH